MMGYLDSTSAWYILTMPEFTCTQITPTTWGQPCDGVGQGTNDEKATQSSILW